MIPKIILGYMSRFRSLWAFLCQLYKLLYRREAFLSRWLASYRTPRTNLWGRLWLEQPLLYAYNDNHIFHVYNNCAYNHHYKNDYNHDYRNDYNNYKLDLWGSQNNVFRNLNICNRFHYNFYNSGIENDPSRLYWNFSYNK